MHLHHLTNVVNHTLQAICFLDKLKQSKVIPVIPVKKKFDPLDK